MGSILVIDQESGARTHLATCLRSRGHHVDEVASFRKMGAALARDDFDLILVDSNAVGIDEPTLRDLVAQHPEAALAVMTLRPAVAEAVALVRAGAYDYLGKPVSPDDIDFLLRRVIALRSPLRGFTPPPPMRQPLLDSANARMVHAIGTARRVAGTADLPILITGERGTGKSLLAALIHDWSPRRAAPFVTVCCAALTEHGLERTLLDHLSGAIVRGRPRSAERRTIHCPPSVAELGVSRRRRLWRAQPRRPPPHSCRVRRTRAERGDAQ